MELGVGCGDCPALRVLRVLTMLRNSPLRPLLDTSWDGLYDD